MKEAYDSSIYIKSLYNKRVYKALQIPTTVMKTAPPLSPPFGPLYIDITCSYRSKIYGTHNLFTYLYFVEGIQLKTEFVRWMKNTNCQISGKGCSKIHLYLPNPNRCGKNKRGF